MARAAGETWEDVLEYYLVSYRPTGAPVLLSHDVPQFNADRGETDFAYRLGKIFYQGSIYGCPGGIASGSEGVGAVPRNFAYARHYFLSIARQIWPRDPANALQYKASPLKDDHGPIGYAAASAGYLGRMYLRGEGVKADPAIAKMWFERGAEHGDRECHNSLGILYREGFPGVKPDLKKAMAHFSVAAGQELAEAQVNMGKYHYGAHQFELPFFDLRDRTVRSW
jgi:SEL1 protein